MHLPMEITETQKPVAYGMKIFMNNKTIKEMRVKSIFQTLFVGSIAAITVSCANEETTNDTVCINPNGTTFTASDVLTRTSMQHVKGGVGKFFWETGDNIWVDNNGTLVKSNASNITATATTAEFQVSGSFTNSSYPVFYTGTNSTSGNEVTIPTTQTQTAPDNTSHFGQSGDCGVATATRNSTGFKFKLEHKAAYLCFLPRCESASLGPNIYLTKIVVTSDNDITDTYTLDPTAETNTGALTGTGSGNKIELTTKGNYGSTYQNGFPLTNTSASLTTNGAYMVIKPGTHTLRIRYWVKDVATHVEGTITKIIPSHTFAKNEYVNMEADLQIKNYDGDHYYMWDAQNQYWYGYEWTKHLSGNTGQPTRNYTSSSNYPQSSSDANNRWYYEGSGSPFDATHSCATLPNVNEMTWYAAEGDPRWDENELWTTMGHLYKGGMWFKKKAYIIGYNSNTAYDGTDWRTNSMGYSWPISLTLPSAADAGNYFYLPALGWYASGQLYNVGSRGNYWSSSAYPGNSNGAYAMFFGGGLNVGYHARSGGYRAEALQ